MYQKNHGNVVVIDRIHADLPLMNLAAHEGDAKNARIFGAK